MIGTTPPRIDTPQEQAKDAAVRARLCAPSVAQTGVAAH
jgi:hypothetical protein